MKCIITYDGTPHAGHIFSDSSAMRREPAYVSDDLEFRLPRIPDLKVALDDNIDCAKLKKALFKNEPVLIEFPPYTATAFITQLDTRDLMEGYLRHDLTLRITQAMAFDPWPVEWPWQPDTALGY